MTRKDTPFTTGPRPALEPTLDARAYLDDDVLAREWERIFCRSWLAVGRAADLVDAGDFRTVTLGRDSVLVVRGKDAALRAFHNVCRHRGARLCAADEGRLKGAVVCPYHAWTYGLDGRLLATPHLASPGAVALEERGLHPVALAEWAGFVFINLEQTPAPLASQVGGMDERVARYPLASLQRGARHVHEVAANWKILMENYMECYHCPGVHPELCDLVPLYRRGIVDAAGTDLVARFRPGATTFTRDGTTRRPFLAGLTDEDTRRYSGEAVLPNMMLNLFPDYAHTRTLWPLSPGRTRIVSEWLFDPATMARPGFDPGDAVEFMNLVGRQDWEVCERVQLGVASRAFKGGVYTPQEADAASFKRWVDARLAPEA